MGALLEKARLDEARQKADEQIRASLAEKELLLREINHRVKNNLQIVSSLLYLQSREVQDPQARMVFEASQDRIKAMALVHEKLYQSPDLARIDFGEYIRSLTTELYSSFGLRASGIGLVVDVDGVNPGIDAAIPCGLIVNELVSNSLKHAFPGRAQGEISIKLRTLGGQHTMVVTDDGIGYPADLELAQVDSLGLTIVKALGIDFGEYIRSLTTELYSSFGLRASGIGLVVDVDGVNPGIDAAIPCGLIVNELVSNSLKHAFPGRAQGEISIKLRTLGGQHTMVVTDDGIGYPADLELAQVDSLGLTIVKALAAELGGEVTLRSRGCAQTEINFPAN